MAVYPKGKKGDISDKTELWENVPWMEEDTAEDIKASRKSGDTEDPVDVLFYDPIAIRLSRLFIKMGWPANAVTLISLVFGVGGSILFYPQNRWINLIGIVVVIFAAILDCCDGQIARLTNTSSQFGRFLDGMVDTTNFLSLYIVLGLRMTKESIPFTEVSWSFYIWIVILVTMYYHASQARIADYYRGLHLFFLNGSSQTSLARSKNLKKEIEELPKNTPLYERVYRYFYLIYTKAQERCTPNAQRLLSAVEEMGGDVPKEVSEAYITQSRRYIQTTNTLTFNLRAYTLFMLLMLRLQAFYFPFVVVILEVVKIVMIAKYERIAKNVYGQFFAGRTPVDQAGRDEDRKDQ